MTRGPSPLGNALARRGRVEEAIAASPEALDDLPRSDDVKAYFGLGNAFAGRRQFDEAVVQYRKVLELQPDDTGGPPQPRQRP